MWPWQLQIILLAHLHEGSFGVDSARGPHRRSGPHGAAGALSELASLGGEYLLEDHVTARGRAEQFRVVDHL